MCTEFKDMLIKKGKDRNLHPEELTTDEEQPPVLELLGNNSSQLWCWNLIKGEGGVPRVQIMKNDLECLGDTKGHGGHLILGSGDSPPFPLNLNCI